MLMQNLRKMTESPQAAACLPYSAPDLGAQSGQAMLYESRSDRCRRGASSPCHLFPYLSQVHPMLYNDIKPIPGCGPASREIRRVGGSGRSTEARQARNRGKAPVWDRVGRTLSAGCTGEDVELSARLPGVIGLTGSKPKIGPAPEAKSAIQTPVLKTLHPTCVKDRSRGGVFAGRSSGPMGREPQDIPGQPDSTFVRTTAARQRSGNVQEGVYYLSIPKTSFENYSVRTLELAGAAEK
jgi:hypothetical protein